MVTAFAIPGAANGAGRPRGISAAVLFTILFHIALGWYVVSRFMFVPGLDVPDEPLTVTVEPYVKPAPPPPPAQPVVEPDRPKPPPLHSRPMVRYPVDHSDVPPAPLPAPAPGPSGPAVSAPVSSPPVAPSPTYKVQPAFPDGAIQDEVNGSVVVQLTIGPGGEVTDAQVVEEKPGRYGFGAAALKAVRQWRFATAAPGTYRVTVKFALKD